MPNAEVVEKSEVQGAGKDEFREETRKTAERATIEAEQESQEWIGRIKKNTSQTARKQRFCSSAVSGEQLVSLDGVLPTRDRTLTSMAASCFLSKDGCRGNGRAAEGG